jgi:hypothetical protein
MPKGPQGQKRPADAIGAAIRVARIATGEEQETPQTTAKAKGGRKGGPARAKALTPAQRSEIASIAAQARWKKSD